MNVTGTLRPAITPGRLYAHLCAQFTLLRPTACSSCRMPLPYASLRPDDVSANWRIGTPAPCHCGCDAVIAEIVANTWTRFDIHPLRVL
jgi:hypothetical protein